MGSPAEAPLCLGQWEPRVPVAGAPWSGGAEGRGAVSCLGGGLAVDKAARKLTGSVPTLVLAPVRGPGLRETLRAT